MPIANPVFGHKEHYNSKNLWLLHIASMSVTASLAMFAYFQSLFLQTVFGEQWVGPIFVLSSGISFVFVFPILRLCQGMSLKIVAMLFTILVAAAFALLTIATSPGIVLVAFVTLAFSQIHSVIAVDILTELSSLDRITGFIRAIRLELYNLAIMVSPLAAGWIMSRSGFFILFSVSALLLMPALAAMTRISVERGENKKAPGTWWKTLLRIRSNPALWRIAGLALALQLFYGVMVVYATLYLLSAGYSAQALGQLLFVILIPFVLLQYPAGIIADRWLGEKELLIIGILLMGVFTIGFAATAPNSALVITAMLFMTRIGASLVEVMRDTAFYKHIDGRDTDAVAFLWSLSPMGYLLATIMGSLVLSMGNYQDLFILTGVIILSTLPAALTLKDTK